MKKLNRKTSFRICFHSSILTTVGLLWLLCACSGTKYLAENESFYTGAEIEFDVQEKTAGKKRIRKSLEEQIRAKPNTKILGMRPGVWFYHFGDETKEKGINAWIRRKLGKKPVLLRDVDPERTANVLQGTLVNDGYFESLVTSSIETKKKESEVMYTVQLYPPFTLREIHYPEPKDSIYRKIVRDIEEESYLKPGQRFVLARLEAEQSRIEELVENKGFYFFDDRHVMYDADSTVGNRQVDLFFRLAPGVPDKAKRIYRLGKIDIFTDYTLSRDTTLKKADTVRVDGYNYVERTSDYRPRVITRVINLRPDSIYRRVNHEYTLNHLMGLGTFKYVNVKYTEADSATLNTEILLTPYFKKSIRLELQAVSKSNNFVGPGLGVTFTNRNFLGGAEEFELNVNTSYEVQISNKQDEALNAFELSVESRLSVPRFISPFDINYTSTRYIPHTQFRLGFNLQRRLSYFQLNSFNAAYGYNWRETITRNHQLDLVDITFVQLSNTSREFDLRLEENSFLANSFQDQFIVGTRYSYTYNSQLKEDPTKQFETGRSPTNNFFFNGNVDVAGNLLNGIQSAFREKSDSVYTLFGQAYSQYVKGDIDLRYYWQIDDNNELASRIVIGSGYPLGNSKTLPYIKQYAVGGSNSVRAFPARSVGPGTYSVFEDDDIEGGTAFIDQRGDLKLEGSVEFRFDLFKPLEGAVFVDAGNIWLWDRSINDSLGEDETNRREGGRFNADTFLKELAVGTGLGLRIDLSFFILRFDLAFPLRKPWYDEGDRWVFDEIDFGSSSWRSNNFVFNIAIGYPF